MGARSAFSSGLRMAGWPRAKSLIHSFVCFWLGCVTLCRSHELSEPHSILAIEGKSAQLTWWSPDCTG